MNKLIKKISQGHFGFLNHALRFSGPTSFKDAMRHPYHSIA